MLNGSELAGFIKERQARQVRSLRSKKIYPKLAIVQVKTDPVTNAYMRMKKKYGDDIGVEVDIHNPSQAEAAGLIQKLNEDESVYGIIVQLPLPDPSETDELVNLISPNKDIDGLGDKAEFEPATPMAILWLLAGYNIDLQGRKVLLIGLGKLVGAPLKKIFESSGVKLTVATRENKDLTPFTLEADVIISAANAAAILTSNMLKPGTVVVDAGVAGEAGKTVGNLAEEVYERDDLVLTPRKGGVGPLTVCALFENVIRAAEKKSHETKN